MNDLILTCDNCRKESNGFVRRFALGPHGLQDVLSEGQGGNSIAGRHQDEQRHPQVQEGRQWPERIANVRVITAGLGYHGSCESEQTLLIRIMAHDRRRMNYMTL